MSCDRSPHRIFSDDGPIQQSKWEKAERIKKRFRRYVFMPIVVFCLPAILVYAGHLKDYCSMMIFEHGEQYEAKVIKREKEQRTKLINEAYTHLVRNEYNDAQRMLNYILKTNRPSYWANYGMVKTLVGQCQTQGIYCDRISEYIEFTKQLGDKHLVELDSLLEVYPVIQETR